MYIYHSLYVYCGVQYAYKIIDIALSLGEGGEGLIAGLGGHQSPESMELLLQFVIWERCLVSFLHQ